MDFESNLRGLIATGFLRIKTVMGTVQPCRQSSGTTANIRTMFIRLTLFVGVFALIFCLGSARAVEGNDQPEQNPASQSETKAAKPVELPDKTIASEQGIVTAETGVGFLPDESGVACFTKLGRFNTDDRGIHITYRRRKPDLYITTEFDAQENKYHIVFGNTYCRYTITVQREIKVSGRWKLSTMAD